MSRSGPFAFSQVLGFAYCTLGSHGVAVPLPHVRLQDVCLPGLSKGCLLFLWQVGAQNAGKSSLINAMRRAVGKGDVKAEITTAAVPGTTLGALALPSNSTAKLHDCLPVCGCECM